MLRVTIESLPHDTGKIKTILDVIEITNEGGSLENGDYRVRRRLWPAEELAVRIVGYPREDGWLGLVFRALGFLEQAEQMRK